MTSHPGLRPARILGTVLILLVAALVVPAGLAPRAAAAGTSYVSGTLSCGGSPPHWDNQTLWVLTANVTVPAGCTLVIDPGTSVRANLGVHLYVSGQLLANGTSKDRISFDVNGTASSWAGIQFNPTSKGSYIEYATIRMADTGVRAIRSSPFLQFDTIDHAYTGTDYWDSSGWVGWTTVNYTVNPIRANGSLGSPIIVANTVRTVLGDPTVGILANNVNSVTIQSNTIRGLYGANRSTAPGPLTNGAEGGYVVGIAVIGSAWANLAGNTIDRLLGGRGGNGANGILTQSNGGAGGSAIGLLILNTPYARMQNNGVTNLVGGFGGDGGAASSALGVGGTGGKGGEAVAIEIANATTQGWWFYNSANRIVGGSGGNGTSAGGAFGPGGAGGNAFGLFAMASMNSNASNLQLQNLRGGYGGNSSNGALGTTGGAGGQASGIWMLNMDGTAIVGNNTVQTLTGGQGGTGLTAAGPGGATSGILLGGDRSPTSGNIPYNLTTVANNQVIGLTGGAGGLGSLVGPNGGTVAGIAATNVTLVSVKNTIRTLTGGLGGSAASGQPAGSGGDAFALIAGLVPKASSSLDTIATIAGGARGTFGNPPPPSRGVGLYVAGNRTLTARATFTNGSIATVNDVDLYLDNYTATTSLNSTFSSTKLAVAPAANLTVQNFLAVRALWPNNVSQVWGTRIVIKDNGAEVYNKTSALGYAKWIAVTNRVYLGSPIAAWNTTQVSVSYQTYTFLTNPRAVNMTASQTLTFVMADTTPPTSSAAALPAYETTRSFGVWYTYGDGLGVGVANITLWYRLNGTVWVNYGLQASGVLPLGMFSFTASTDGTFEFATTAIDKVGNAQQPRPPTANNTWTIVDTTKPRSQIAALPTYTTSTSFTVSWGPSAGTTDIAKYMIQYNASSAWVTWLNASAPASITFNATSQGVYQFRSIATDRAGNVEVKTTNDTWTFIDSIVPTSAVTALPAYETTASFTVAWGPTGGTSDIVDYTVQMSLDGGPWTDWLTGVTSTSASFLGTDGHRYAFRSLARDAAGNVEAKTGNDTWTIVDTSPPSSSVAALPAYETTLSFVVAWAPDPGTTDVATYRIEYNTGSGWVTWFGDTTLTSSSFTATGQGPYEFRSLATDRAGNVETKTGNDTWTLVDSIVPTSLVAALPTYETTASFAVSWGPTGTTTDVRTYALQVSEDGATWVTWFSGATNRSATFSGADGHRYAFRSLATDAAGNTEAKTGNDTWTLVDTTTPASSVGTLPRYETVLTFPVSWGPSTGTADVAAYTIQMSRDGGTWTAWLSGVTNRSAVFTGADGHTYAFRSLATDAAGNVEAKTGNDTFTSIDATLPTILLEAPEGGGVAGNTTITVTFSEPMDRASVEAAFSLSPSMDGSFAWNAAGTVLTFTPSRPLAAGTQYTVVLATGARDLAGNGMAAIRTFTFTTAAAPAGPAGFSILDWWPLLVLVAVAAAVVVALLLRRRGAQAPEVAPKAAPPAAAVGSSAAIDDVFLLYRKDGILIKHETRRLRPDIDSDILSGMLNAVQQFVKDSLLGTEGDELNEMVLGQMHILIGRGKWLVLAATITGGDMASMNLQIQTCVKDMEDHNWDRLEDWNGDMDLAKVLSPYLRKLIRGEYAA